MTPSVDGGASPVDEAATSRAWDVAVGNDAWGPLIPRGTHGRAVRVPLVEALKRGAATWASLEDASPSAAPFAGWAWHRAWAASAPEDEVAASWAIIGTSASGEPDALLPIGVRTVTFRRQRVTALTWAIGDVGCPDHLDVLASTSADVDALAAALTELPGDILILDNLAADAPHAHQLAAALRRRRWAVRQRPQWRCPYLALPGSWDAYLASVSAGWRQSLRRRERALARDHTVTVTDYGLERLEEGWRQLVTLHARRWDGAGALKDLQVDRLHRSFIRDLAHRDRLWLATLDLDGEPAAAWFGFTGRDTVYFYQSGRDPRFDKESVGVVLMATVIRRAIERGYQRFDFLRGDEAYKRQWTSAARMTKELVAFRPSWRGRYLHGLDLVGRLRAKLRAPPTGGAVA